MDEPSGSQIDWREMFIQNQEMMKKLDERLDALQEKPQQPKLSDTQLKRLAHQNQYDFNTKIIDKLQNLKTMMRHPENKNANNVLADIVKTIEKRQKHIKIADRSPAGWNTVREYLSDDLASDSEDERKIKKAEKRALVKQDEKKEKFRKTDYKKTSTSNSSTTNWQNNTKERTYGRQYRPKYNENASCFKCGRKGHYKSTCYATSTINTAFKR